MGIIVNLLGGYALHRLAEPNTIKWLKRWIGVGVGAGIAKLGLLSPSLGGFLHASGLDAALSQSLASLVEPLAGYLAGRSLSAMVLPDVDQAATLALARAAAATAGNPPPALSSPTLHALVESEIAAALASRAHQEALTQFDTKATPEGTLAAVRAEALVGATAGG